MRSAELRPEEVEAELEALVAVYGEEAVHTSEQDDPTTILVDLCPSTAYDSSSQFVQASLKLQLADRVQGEAFPWMVYVAESKGLGDGRKAKLLDLLRAEVLDLALDCTLGHICQRAQDYLTNENFPDGQCTMCLEGMVHDADSSTPLLVKLSCFHVFHRQCLVEWWSWQQHRWMSNEATLIAHTGAASMSLGLPELSLPPKDQLPPELQSELQRQTEGDDGEDSDGPTSVLPKEMKYYQSSCPVCRVPFHLADFSLPVLRSMVDACMASVPPSSCDHSASSSDKLPARPSNGSDTCSPGAEAGTDQSMAAGAGCSLARYLSEAEVAAIKRQVQDREVLYRKQQQSGGIIEEANYSITHTPPTPPKAPTPANPCAGAAGIPGGNKVSRNQRANTPGQQYSISSTLASADRGSSQSQQHQNQNQQKGTQQGQCYDLESGRRRAAGSGHSGRSTGGGHSGAQDGEARGQQNRQARGGDGGVGGGGGQQSREDSGARGQQHRQARGGVEGGGGQQSKEDSGAGGRQHRQDRGGGVGGGGGQQSREDSGAGGRQHRQDRGGGVGGGGGQQSREDSGARGQLHRQARGGGVGGGDVQQSREDGAAHRSHEGGGGGQKQNSGNGGHQHEGEGRRQEHKISGRGHQNGLRGGRGRASEDSRAGTSSENGPEEWSLGHLKEEPRTDRGRGAGTSSQNGTKEGSQGHPKEEPRTDGGGGPGTSSQNGTKEGYKGHPKELPRTDGGRGAGSGSQNGPKEGYKGHPRQEPRTDGGRGGETESSGPQLQSGSRVADIPKKEHNHVKSGAIPRNGSSHARLKHSEQNHNHGKHPDQKSPWGGEHSPIASNSAESQASGPAGQCTQGASQPSRGPSQPLPGCHQEASTSILTVEPGPQSGGRHQGASTSRPTVESGPQSGGMHQRRQPNRPEASGPK
eukprot:gene6532-3174_t